MLLCYNNGVWEQAPYLFNIAQWKGLRAHSDIRDSLVTSDRWPLTLWDWELELNPCFDIELRTDD